MLCDQGSSIASNRSGIERMKARRQKAAGLSNKANDGPSPNDSWREVFGDPGYFNWRWLVPVRVTYNEPEKLFGYCVSVARQTYSSSNAMGERAALLAQPCGVGGNRGAELEYLPE